MMKRFALAAVVALSLFSLTACSGEEKQETTTPSPAVEEATPAAPAEGAATDSTTAATESMPAETETATH